MKITLVPPGQIASLIPALLQFLQASVTHAKGRVTVDDILRFVLTGQMNLWAVHEGGVCHGHVITETKQYPQCKMLVVQYCAMATGVLEQVEGLMQVTAEGFARAAGCQGIEFTGRPGWRATSKKYGYDTQSVTYQKFFKEVRDGSDT
jgi:hypothetical protein